MLGGLQGCISPRELCVCTYMCVAGLPWPSAEAGVRGRPLGPCLGGLGCPAPGDATPTLSQLLYTLTFWLLLRQFVKEKLLKKGKVPAALTEVTVADTGKGRGRQGTTPPAWPQSHVSAASLT